MTAVMSWRADQPRVPAIRVHQHRVTLFPVTGLPAWTGGPAADRSGYHRAARGIREK